MLKNLMVNMSSGAGGYLYKNYIYSIVAGIAFMFISKLSNRHVYKNLCCFVGRYDQVFGGNSFSSHNLNKIIYGAVYLESVLIPVEPISFVFNFAVRKWVK